MKRNFRRIQSAWRGLSIFLIVSTILGSLLIAGISPAAAQDDNPPTPTPELPEAQTLESQGATISYNSSGYANFISLGAAPLSANSFGAPQTAVEAAQAFLDIYGVLFGLENGAQELLPETLAATDERSIVRFQQVIQSVPVLGGELNVQLDSGNNIRSANGEVTTQTALTASPAVDSGIASQNAIAVVTKVYNVDASILTTTAPELWFYDPKLIGPGEGPIQLVWRLEVHADELSPINELVLVNAASGNIVLNFSQVDSIEAMNDVVGGQPEPVSAPMVQPAAALGSPDLATYTANHGNSIPGTLLCTEANNPCTSGGGANADANAAHQYARDTYAFYANNFGRDSINGSGLEIKSTVNYGNGYQNAFWNGSQMVYGDGFSLADDVVGHELTHGVTQYESNLLYYYQSGAINEALSDIFGEFVDLTNGAGNDAADVRWLLGEDLPIGYIRNMQNPPQFNDPDKITSSYYYLGSDNSTSVHTNSGVANKAAYLITDGGSFNGYTVTGLGINKASQVFYEAQKNLLTSGSDYADLYSALYQACLNLAGGSAGITPSDCVEVKDAVNATEMNLQPAANFNVDAPVCPTGQVPIYRFYDALESGTGSWAFGAQTGTNRWQLDAPASVGPFAHSGLHSLYANDSPSTTSDSSAAMNRDVTSLPANAYLHFDQAYWLEYSANTAWDGGVLEYSTNSGASWNDAASLFDNSVSNNGYDGTLGSGNPLAGRQAFSSVSHGYISSRYNLNSLAGQSVRFRFRLVTDSSLAAGGWWVDDVRIYTCAALSHVAANFDGDNLSDPALYYNNGTWAWLTSGNGYSTPNNSQVFNTGGGATPLNRNDFDGDGRTDPTVFYPDWGQIFWQLSSTRAQGQFGYFTSTDHPVAISANDYDGDGKSDPALFYPTNGVWSWNNSSNNSNGLAAFDPAGNPTPVANADMNGDGKSDPALFYTGTGLFAWNTNGTVGTAAFNPVGSPVPYLADFDGDGKSDPAVYYQTYALWAWKRSSDGQINTAAFNPNGSPQPVVGFFDNDNKADAGLYYATWGLWAWKRSSDGAIGTAAYNPGGNPEPQNGYDFDGDGKSDPALYYRTWGLWAWKESSTGTNKTAAYNPNGNPVAFGGLDFDGDGKAEPASYYRDWGLWVWMQSSDNTIVTRNMNSGGSPQPVR